MKVEWHPRDGFEVLKQRIRDGMMYPASANKPISPNDALNMIMIVIAQTRLFVTQYQEWHGRNANEKSSCTPLNFGDSRCAC